MCYLVRAGPDIVIGARRPSHHRTLRGAAIAVALSAVTLLVGYFIYLRVVSYTEPSVDIDCAGGTTWTRPESPATS
ncbi:MAG: hypothetical protein MJE77_19690 [Proteobacteria bacterium]|nr:hypothetical protein [Pseudomonadota bacterium]